MTIDVSELLLDADFVGPLTLINRTETIDQYGVGTYAETPVNTIGSVQPASGKTLQRLPESLRLPGVMEFWIKTEIVIDGAGKYPSVILWQGKRYNVQSTAPWLNWGAGWNNGTCVSEEPA